MVDPLERTRCRAIPLNQPGKLEYDREIKPTDLVFTTEEFLQIMDKYGSILNRCESKK